MYLVDKNWIKKLEDIFFNAIDKYYLTENDIEKCNSIIKENILNLNEIEFPKIKCIDKIFYYYENHSFINKEALDFFLKGFKIIKDLIKINVYLNKNVYCIEYNEKLFDCQFKNNKNNIISRYIICIPNNKYKRSTFTYNILQKWFSFLEYIFGKDIIYKNKIILDDYYLINNN